MYINQRTSPEHEAFVREIAGEGTVDERCHRILQAFGPLWWGEPDPEVEPAPPDDEDEEVIDVTVEVELPTISDTAYAFLSKASRSR